MPGRQAHGRSLVAGQGSGGKRKQQRSKAKSNKTALDAFAIANKAVGDKGNKLTPRSRGLDADLGEGKHGRDEDEDDEEDDEDDERPPRKMRRAGGGGKEDSDIEYGSDSSGNEWRIGVGEDDDSEIESDDAFGESEEEKFEGYAFRGSTKNKADAEEDDEDDEADGASLGSDAIDLAAALDMSMSEDEGEPVNGAATKDDDSEESGSGADESDSGGGSSSDEEDDDDDVDDDVDEAGVKNWVDMFSGVKDQNEGTVATKTKIGLKDLGLLGVKDPQLKKSLKLMSKEEKSSKPLKLEVPLERRQQGRIDRAAAYEKTNETLDRWNETVKQNRRAEHLMFPLAQNETGIARHDNSEIQPLNSRTPGTELEQTILGIMEESGLGPKPQNTFGEQLDADGQVISQDDLKALWADKRRQRELKSREDSRAKRIKKIKSKAYHRVHRKQREREDQKEHEAAVAAGEVDSDDEREARDRQRAMERMGARHRDSRWAKMSKKDGRAAWDDDVRLGIADMARRDEELRRRVDGKQGAGGSDDESNYSGGSDDEDDRARLLQELHDVSAVDDETSGSKLMNMAFMKKAEAAKKKANDELVAEIRRDLASDGEEFDESDAEPEEVGRRNYGVPAQAKAGKTAVSKKAKKQQGINKEQAQEKEQPTARPNMSGNFAMPAVTATGGAWSSAAPADRRRKQKGPKLNSDANVLDLDASVAVVARTTPSQPKSSTQVKSRPKSEHKTLGGAGTGDDVSSDGEESHMPIQFREQELLDKAFGGLDVVADFEAEKRAVEEEDDEKVVDNTLPGWGSWVGDDVSARERKKHKGRFLTKTEGVNKKDRKDAKLKSVIVNEKIVKKNNKYLASQMPHPFESVMQYERSLRLPIGAEWVTKETFQDATKPRVIVKQGHVIAPMSKPLH